MKKIIFLFISFIFFSAILVISSNNVLAAKYKCGESGSTSFDSLSECQDPRSNCNDCVEITVDTPSAPNAPVSLINPLGGTKDKPQGKTSIPELLGSIINSVMGIIGSLALVMFIYGGATWMLSAGNQEQVTKGKNALIWATVGLVIIFTAYALVKFVLTTVTSG